MTGQGGDWSLSTPWRQMRPDPQPRRWGDWTGQRESGPRQQSGLCRAVGRCQGQIKAKS